MSERDIPERRQAETKDRKIEITNREYEHVDRMARSEEAHEIALRVAEEELKKLRP